jgi:hypothetical protein
MHTKFWLESLKGRELLEGLGIGGRKIKLNSCELYFAVFLMNLI